MVMLEECPDACPGEEFCAFNDWRPWGQCTATCGSGHRPRVRFLVPTTSGSKEVPKDRKELTEDLMARFDELSLKAAAASVRDPKDLAIAFACGGLTLGLAMFIYRIRAGGTRPQQFERIELISMRETAIPLASDDHY
jgi:hypothetical protein